MPTPLHQERLDAVVTALLASGARTVLDLGCGRGELLEQLLACPQFKKIVGVDVSAASLQAAEELLRPHPAADRERLAFIQSSYTEVDERLFGFDAALLVETIEHIESHQLSQVEQVVFACYQPNTVILTTPNREYNVLYGLAKGAVRHRGHRFEWERARFQRWACGVAERNGYRVKFFDVGDLDPVLGGSTQMAVFSR
jgi:small RNA 2'-O-methyltransferase